MQNPISRGTGSHNSSSTTFTLSPNANLSQSSIALLIVTVDNAETGGISHTIFSVSDSHNNTWQICANRTENISATANAGSQTKVFWCEQNISQLTTSSIITVTLNVATVAKVWTLWEIIPNTNYKVTPISVTSSQFAGTSPSQISDNIVQNGNLIFGILSAEYGTTLSITEDSDTTNGSWSTQELTQVGSTESGLSLTSQWKIVTADARQTYNLTLGTNVGGCIFIIEFNEYQDGEPILRYKGMNVTVGTSFNFQLLNNFKTNSAGLLFIAADNANASGLPFTTFNVIDSSGNTWNRLTSPHYTPVAVVNVGITGGIWLTSQNISLLNHDNLITTTFNTSTTAKAWQLWEIPNFYGSGGGGNGTGVSSTTPTATTHNISSGNLLFGVALVELNNALTFTQDSDTNNGSWSNIQQTSSTGGINDFGVSVGVQWKRTTASGIQTYNPTLGTSSDSIITWIEIKSSGLVSSNIISTLFNRQIFTFYGLKSRSYTNLRSFTHIQ